MPECELKWLSSLATNAFMTLGDIALKVTLDRFCQYHSPNTCLFDEFGILSDAYIIDAWSLLGFSKSWKDGNVPNAPNTVNPIINTKNAKQPMKNFQTYPLNFFMSCGESLTSIINRIAGNNQNNYPVAFCPSVYPGFLVL